MRTFLLLLITVIALQSARAWADAESESQALTRVLHELDLLEPLLAEAEAAADPDARVHFRYDWLKNDLARVRAGIEEHVDALEAITLPVIPLRGDYRR
jgi:RAQPRD family integrative conjugative element protein